MSERYYAHENFNDAAARTHRTRYYVAKGFTSRGDSVLDIGCGCGYGSEILGEIAEEIIGIDYNEKAILHARLHHANVYDKFAIYNLEENIFPDIKGIDVSVAIEFLEHIDKPQELLQQLKKITKKFIIISVPAYINSVGINPHHKHDIKEEQIKEWMIDENWQLYDSIRQDIHLIAIFYNKAYGKDILV